MVGPQEPEFNFNAWFSTSYTGATDSISILFLQVFSSQRILSYLLLFEAVIVALNHFCSSFLPQKLFQNFCDSFVVELDSLLQPSILGGLNCHGTEGL